MLIKSIIGPLARLMPADRISDKIIVVHAE